jgi:hypothetical protein
VEIHWKKIRHGYKKARLQDKGTVPLNKEKWNEIVSEILLNNESHGDRKQQN